MFDYSRKPVKWQVGNFSHSIHICIPKSGHVYIYDTSDRRFFMETSTFFILDEKIGNNIGDGTCMNLITATRLPLNSRGSEDLRTRCCKNHPTLNGLPINIDGAHFQRACLLSLHSPQVVDLRLLSVDAFSVMCQLQYHYLMYWDSQFYVLGLSVLSIVLMSPSTPDSQSKYPGLPVRRIRTLSFNT